MNTEPLSYGRLSDDQLLAEADQLAASERTATVRLIAALAEIDTRRLYLGQGCSSLFAYCTRVLHLSEHAAYGRIEAARAARRWPGVLEMLDTGELTLSSLSLLAPHLSDENYRDVLTRARYRSKREVEEIVAGLRPRPDVAPLMRRVPAAPTPFGTPKVDLGTAPPSRPGADTRASMMSALTARESSPGCPPPPPAAVPNPPGARRASMVEPLSPGRYKLQVTIGQETRDKLRRAQELIRHSLPSGDVATILDRALDLLLADLERRKIAAAVHPRRPTESKAGSRNIPAAVRRAVWRRDEGRCAFSRGGRRCDERSFIEFHHVCPFEAGGEATEDNIQLRCRAHNQYEADLFCGEPFILRERSSTYAGVQLGPLWTELPSTSAADDVQHVDSA